MRMGADGFSRDQHVLAPWLNGTVHSDPGSMYDVDSVEHATIQHCLPNCLWHQYPLAGDTPRSRISSWRDDDTSRYWTFDFHLYLWSAPSEDSRGSASFHSSRMPLFQACSDLSC